MDLGVKSICRQQGNSERLHSAVLGCDGCVGVGAAMSQGGNCLTAVRPISNAQAMQVIEERMAIALIARG